jgi:hypothetical protein
MNEVRETTLMVFLAILPMMVVGGGILIALVAMWRQVKMQEMRHRERLAMIERGLMPPPERDPAAFHASFQQRAPGRFLSFGIALVAVGLGLMLIIAFAGGAPGPAVGVGGAIALLGIGFIINSQLQRGNYVPAPQRTPGSLPSPPPPLGPTNPPGSVAP